MRFSLYIIIVRMSIQKFAYLSFIAAGSLFGSIEAAKSSLLVKLMQVRL